MKLSCKILTGLALWAAFTLCVPNSAFGAWELVKAFAFGADEWTRATYNEPSVQYIKVAQETGLNGTYDAGQGHGYTDITALDTSANNRGLYSGDDEIYDQFVGAKLSAGPDPMLFRIDVENGNYKFVGAGGDADNANHATIMRARDGDTDTEILLCDDFLPTANGQFWRCEFGDKVVPPASTDPPSFPADGRIECPFLEVTQGYIVILEQVGTHPDGNGGDLCLIEVWLFKGATAGPDQTVEAGQTVTLSGAGPEDTTSFAWEQVIQGDEPVVTLVNPSNALCTFDAPVRDIGYMLTFRLTVVSPTEGTTTDEVQVKCMAPNVPQVAPGNLRMVRTDSGFWLHWDEVFDASVYSVEIEYLPDIWVPVAPNVQVLEYEARDQDPGNVINIRVVGKNSYGSGAVSEPVSMTIMRNLGLPAPSGGTPPSAYVTFSGADAPGINNGAHDDDNNSSDGQFKTEDFWGYLWDEPLIFNEIDYYTGSFSWNGGWFTDLTVQYTKDGETWEEVAAVTITPEYDFADAPANLTEFGRYVLSFLPVRGTGMRVFGTPGGVITQTFTSVSELEVYGNQTAGPLVVYGVDATFDERAEAVLDGNNSFSTAGPLSQFEWVQTGGGAVSISGADQAAASFTAPGVDADTVLTFQFTAGDGVDSDTDDVSITIRNLVTTAVAGPDRMVDEGAVVTLDGTGSLSTSADLSYSWTQRDTDNTKVSLIGADTATPSFTAPALWNYHEALNFDLEVDDGVGPVGTDSVTITIRNFMAGNIPGDPWGLTSADISGPVDNPNNFIGSTIYDPDLQTYTVTADGEDIWDHDDGCRLVFKEVGPDFTSISVRIDQPATAWPDGWTKVGVMVRQDLDPDSPFVMLVAATNNGIIEQARTVKGESAWRYDVGDDGKALFEDGTRNFTGPVWVRLERDGDTYIGSFSYNGTDWLREPQIWADNSAYDLPLSTPFYAGIVLTSHTGSATATATFGDLKFNDDPAAVLPDAYAYRTLLPSYQAGAINDVSLSFRVNPNNPPASVTITEQIPTGLSVVTGSISHGGAVDGDTITWNLTGAEVESAVIGYSLDVPHGTTAGLEFAGDVNGDNTFGDQRMYAVPTAPLYVTLDTTLGISLSWSPPPEEGADTYRVERSLDGGDWELVAATTETSYSEGMVEGSTYSYRVMAVNRGGVEGPFCDPTDAMTVTVPTVVEAENYNYGGGLYPGAENCDAANEAPDSDTVGTPADYDFFYATDVPVDDTRRFYRPNDNCGMETREATPNIGWTTIGDWWRYTLDVPEPGPGEPTDGWARVGLKIASNPTCELYWDEGLIGTVSASTGDWGAFVWAPLADAFRTTPGEHTLRVKMVSGGMNFDSIGVGFNQKISREAIFEDDFEDYTNLYNWSDLETVGNWDVINGANEALVGWRLWSTTGDYLGDETDDRNPAIAGMTGNYVITDSDLEGTADLDEQLVTPDIDCTEYIRLKLDFSKNFRVYPEDLDHTQIAELDIREVGGDWVNLLSYNVDSIDPLLDPAVDSSPEKLDLSAYDGKTFQLRWHFYDATWDWWWAIDNVMVSGEPKPTPPPPKGVILTVRIAAGKLSVTWSVFGTESYYIDYTTDLTGAWSEVAGPLTGTSSSDVVISGSSGFYRVRAE